MIQRNTYTEDRTLLEINVSCLDRRNRYSRILGIVCFVQIAEMAQSKASIRGEFGLRLFVWRERD
jgi:hypothetical protein